MPKKKQQNLEPPQPPSIKREFKLNPIQIIGIPLMMLVPILALLGAFGESDHAVTASNPGLEMHIEYPTRFRYKMTDSVTLSLSNTSSEPFSRVEIAFDRNYVEGFSTVSFTPSVKHVTDTAYVVELSDLQPAETRVISVSIQAENYGRHSGSITATPDAGQPLRVSIATFTFP